jgi:hypothetical protein
MTRWIWGILVVGTSACAARPAGSSSSGASTYAAPSEPLPPYWCLNSTMDDGGGAISNCARDPGICDDEQLPGWYANGCWQASEVSCFSSYDVELSYEGPHCFGHGYECDEWQRKYAEGLFGQAPQTITVACHTEY